MDNNLKAFLDMLAQSELGGSLLGCSDNGYNVIVGSTAHNPILFDSYADHPRKSVNLGNGLYSTAAGRYQILAHIFDSYKKQLNLSDFSPASQDAIAIQIIKERKELYDIAAGDIKDAITHCSNIWASLPGNNYGQHMNKLDQLLAWYRQDGGVTV